MKESAVLQNLNDIAAQLNIRVENGANLKKYSYYIKSGLCKVSGEYRIIIDKHLHLSEKIDVLIEALHNFDVDTDLFDPHVKKLFEKKGGLVKKTFLQNAESN